MKHPKTKSAAFHTRLAAYSATAAAAVLAAPDAQGTVQNISSSTLTLAAVGNSNQTQSLTLGVFHGGMHIEHVFSSSGSRYGGFAVLQGGFRVDVRDNGCKLNFGQHIGGGYSVTGGLFLGPGSFVQPATAQSRGGGYLFRHAGQFLPAANQNVTGYVGFRTQQNSHIYYGWLRVQVHADARDLPDQISILTDGNGYVGAYGLTGDDITAGQIAPAPEPGTVAIGGLGLLALGARGVRELRRRRASAAIGAPINSSK